MRLLRFVRRHPIAVLSVFAAAFVVWVWRDAIPAPEIPNPEGVKVEGHVRRVIPPPPPLLGEVTSDSPKCDPAGTAQSLSKLKPGMTRTEVEGLVGVPAPNDIYPATVAGGRVTYHTTYEADLGPVCTIRPIHTPRVRPMPLDPQPADAKTIVTLEFDATKPGHPLLGVHYPDPLF